MGACLEESVLFCDVERCKNLHWVADEAIEAHTEHDKGDVSIDWLQVEHKNAAAVLLIGDVGDHGKDHE